MSTTSAHGNDLTAGMFRLLVENVEDYAIFMLDVHGHILTWNRGAERIKGYSASEIIGRHFATFYTPEDLAAGVPEQALRTALQNGRVEYEGWRLRKDGSRFWADVTITALHDETGAHVGFGKVTRDLTERMLAADQLRRSEQRFRALVEGVRDYAIYMLDPTGHVSTWNSGAENIKGYSAAEIMGKHYSAFFLPEDVAAGRPERELEIALTSGRYEEEGWRVRKDGTRFWANVVLTPLRNDTGELLGFAKVTRDLTAKKHAEETARELVRERAARAAAEDAEDRVRAEREKYRALSRRLEVILESIADGITVQDRSGRVIFANSAAARLCGFDTIEELLRTPLPEVAARFDVVDEDGQPFALARLPGRRALAEGTTSTATLHIRDHRTAREWWTVVRASPVVDDTGQADLAVSVWHDVSADRRREEHERHLLKVTAALSSSLDYDSTLQTLASLLVPGLADWCSIHMVVGDQLQCAVMTHVDEGRASRAHAFATKYPPDRTQARGLWNVVRTGEPELFEAISEETIERVARDEEQLRILRGIGLTSLLIVPLRTRDRVIGTLSLVSAESGRRYDRMDLLLAQEVGRRAGITIENARLYAEAQAAAAVAAAAARAAEEASRVKDEFLATVSHELRTPLNAILGWSTLLQARGADGSVAKGLAVIHRNAQAQGKIIEDILDVSRIITGKLRLDLKSADLVAVVLDALEVVRPSAAAKGISLQFEPPNEPCSLLADPMRLQQVVWNLLSNAVKFTDPGGAIGIILEVEASQVHLSVVDSGRGIDPDFLPYVFDRFKQADASSTRRVGGLGLGLSIVRHIVELHGGSVSASSAGLGKGATFSITLPMRRLVPAVQPTQTGSSRDGASMASQPAGALEGVRVLVVDDEPDARDLLQILLEGAGAVVETASSASDAFEQVQRFRPQLLVSDIAMPTEDGYRLMQRIRSLDASAGGGIPSIALTAYARREDEAMALAAGFTAHIGKPVNPDDLLNAVASLAKQSVAQASS